MTAPALARQQSNDRIYVWPPGLVEAEMVVPSVTTILKQLSKEEKLMFWAAKATATFAVEEILNWQNLPPDAAIDLLKRSPFRYTENKRGVGTAVHKAIELWTVNGTQDVDNLDLLPWVASAVLFMETHATGILERESTVFNRLFQYAGTLDAIVTLKDGRTAIVDWKTGKNIYPEAALQLCAYTHGEFIGDEAGNERPLPDIDLGIVVHLPGDGTYKAREVLFTDRMWRTFQALRTLQAWKEHHEANAFGATLKGSTKQVDEVATRRTTKEKHVAQIDGD